MEQLGKRNIETEKRLDLAVIWSQTTTLSVKDIDRLLLTLRETIRVAESEGVNPCDIQISLPSVMYRSLKL
jgi:hypothetical protein